jgi:hypothetical protein
MFTESDSMAPEFLESSPPTLDDVFLRPDELAARWRVDVNTLANLRARGEGLPWVKLGGGVRYKVADVLAAEASGARGFSWARLTAALEAFDGLSSEQREALLKHLRKAFKS